MYKSIILALVFGVTLFTSCDSEENEFEELSYWTQEDLDKYSVGLLKKRHLNSSITLDYDVIDLSSFANIEEISGKLKILSRELVNLDALSQLRKIESLEIVATGLVEINFAQLLSVDNNIIFTGNKKLLSISMDNLASIGNGIDVVYNEKLNYMKIPHLESYKGINIKQNPAFTNLELNTPIPSEAEWIQIDFKSMNSSDSLFRNSKKYVGIKIGIENIQTSDLTWIEKINPTNFESMTIYGDFDVENFCVIKPMLKNVVHPSNFQIYKAIEYTHVFNGTNILNECN